MNTISSEFKSMLELKNLICIHSSTRRSEAEISDKLQLEVTHNVNATASEAVVSLEVRVFAADETFEAKVKMQGTFGIENVAEPIVKQNTISIIFPYVRSQLSLITSQPGLQPVIIPPLNIMALLDDSKE